MTKSSHSLAPKVSIQNFASYIPVLHNVYIWSLMKVKVKESLSRVRLFATPWTIAYQAPHSMGFSRQEYWSGLPFPSPGDLPEPGIKPESLALQQTLYPLSHLTYHKYGP